MANAVSDRVFPGDAPGNSPETNRLRELIEHWQALDERWKGYLRSLTDESLDGIVHKISTSSGIGKRLGTTRSDVLLHACTHAHYTTAQLMNMLRQLGISPLPDPMLI